MKILVIDDLMHDQKMWEYHVKEYAHVETIYASSPKEAKSILESDDDIEAVFTDFYMGLKTAKDVLKIVDEINLTIPVYLVTGHLPDKKTCDEFTDVIDKSNLKSKIDEILK